MDTIYFLSDRDFGMNEYLGWYHNKTVQQKTFFKEFDCKNLEGDNETLIFENGGSTLARDSNKPVKLTINVIGDFPGLDLTGVKLKNILSLQLFLQMGNVSL
jgi:tricorn protease-like protein